MLFWSSEIYQVQVFQQLHWGGGEGPTSVWPHRDSLFSVLMHTGFRGPSASLLSSVYTLPLPIYSSRQIITAPLLFLLFQGALLGCLMVLESSLAWDDMESGPPRRTQLCSLSESTHLERSAWWSFSLMNEREESEGEQCCFLLCLRWCYAIRHSRPITGFSSKHSQRCSLQSEVICSSPRLNILDLRHSSFIIFLFSNLFFITHYTQLFKR